MFYINRTIENLISEAYKYFSVISVTGPRQSGKSTLLKHLFPHMPMYSLSNGVYFYRDSNQNEVDILLKQEGEITALEIKSSMTYHNSFEKTLSKLSEWIKTPISKKAVIYAGDFENDKGEIAIINYRNLHHILPTLL